jgi:hypothetical protein
MSDENYNHLDSNSQNLNLNNPQQLSSPKQSTVQQTQNEQQPMMDQPITMNQMMMGIIQMGYIIVDPMEILDTAPSIKIKQQIELLEVITGCQTKNRYDVYAEVNSQKYYLFRCKEDSSFCMRNCCTNDNRSFTIKCTLPSGEIFANLHRPFKCTCGCCNRPEMINKDKSDNQFGKVIQPCTCCSPLFEIYNEQNEIKYLLEIPCCQCGFSCRRGICGKCTEVDGNIYKKDNLEKSVGTFRKKEKCIQEIGSNANTFTMHFPNDANVNDKLNLIAALILIDYMFYEGGADETQSVGYGISSGSGSVARGYGGRSYGAKGYGARRSSFTRVGRRK